MATYTQLGSITVQAFQWLGQAFSTLPAWTRNIALHHNGTGVLCVPCRSGTEAAKTTDWVVQDADGSITVMPNSAYQMLYH